MLPCLMLTWEILLGYLSVLVQTNIMSFLSNAGQEFPVGEYQIMWETRFTKFLALSVDLGVGISWSASETND